MLFFALLALLGLLTLNVYAATDTDANTSNSTLSVGPFPVPITPALPSLKEPANTLLEELSTAVTYAVLISNGNADALCKALNATSLSKVPFINGTAVKTTVCNVARIGRQSPELESTLINLNQDWVKYLFTANYGVSVAGGYAGGTDLTNLCNRVDVEVLNNLFIGYLDDRKVGQDVKDYVCSAAAAKPPPSTPTLPPALPNGTNTITTTTATPLLPNCTHPQGFSNTIVPLPPKFAADGHFQIPRRYNDAHELFLTTNTDLSLSEATIATSCLEECFAYSSSSSFSSGSGGGRKCKSIFVNYGKSVPAENGGGGFPPGSDLDEVKWWCHGYDVFLSEGDFVGVDEEESYKKGVVVNRACEKLGFRAF